MDDERFRALVDAAVVTPPARATWDDVLARARRSRRGRRLRVAALVVLTSLGVLVASLATAGQLPFQVSHTHEPHISVHATLVRPDGSRAGTLEIEVQRVFLGFGNRIVVERFQTHRDRTVADAVPARWFLKLDRRDSNAKVALRGLERGDLTLCTECGPSASGRVDLSTDDVAALLNADASVTLFASDGERAASGTATLVRSQLRRALMCTGVSRKHLRCTRIYTGRP
jgi:hypothetical protein